MKNNMYIKLGRDFKDLLKGFGFETLLCSPALILPFIYWKTIFLLLFIYIGLVYIHVSKYRSKGRLVFNKYGIWKIDKQKGIIRREEIPWSDIVRFSYRVEVISGRATFIYQYVDVEFKQKDKNGFVLQKSTAKTSFCLNDYLTYFEQDIYYTRFYYWLKSLLLRRPYTKEDRPIVTYDKRFDACFRLYCVLYDIHYSLKQ